MTGLFAASRRRALPTAEPTARAAEREVRTDGCATAGRSERAVDLETAGRLGGDFTGVPVHSGGSDVRALLGDGVPLPAALRAEQETRFGVPLGDVRVHDDPAAHRLARRHLARALTVGSDIVFNEGHYQPGSQAGQGLLAHELAHVVQQSGRRDVAPAGATRPGAAHEGAADSAAQAWAGGGPVHAGPAAAVGIQAAPLSREEVADLLLPQLTARLTENEREAATLVLSEEYRTALAAEHTWLHRRYAELAGARRSSAEQRPTGQTSAEQASGEQQQPATARADQVAALIDAELAELEPLITRLVADVPAHPRDHALNTVRGVAERTRQDQEFISGFAAPEGGETTPAANAAGGRIQRLLAQITPIVAQAEQWHTANPAGRSLGMINEEAGTALAGRALSDWDRGGWYYLSGAAAFVGVAVVALVEAGEQSLSFGYHDAATAVSQAYTRGDISWNEGESILCSAAWRAVLTAAITRGAGAATSRLGAAAARGAGLAPRSIGAGLLSGGVTGGAYTAVSLSGEALLTTLLRSHFTSPAGQAIWRRGIPSGREWALAIPLGVLLGARAGARAVLLGNERLINSTFRTSDGEELRIVAITPDGQVVVEPVGGLRTSPPPPPPSPIETVFDPADGSWRALRFTGADLATVPPRGAAPAATTPAPAPTPARPATAPATRAPAPVPVPRPAPARAPAVPVRVPRALPSPASAGPTALTPAAPATTPVPAPAVPVQAPSATPAPASTLAPSNARTAAADLRVAETEAALSAAARGVVEARAQVAEAGSKLRAARAGGSPRSSAVRQADLAVRGAQAQLQRLSAGESTAQREATAAAASRARVIGLETEIAQLDAELAAELNPPGGFTTEQLRAGRRAGVVPSIGQPSGARYHRLNDRRLLLDRQSAAEVARLRRSLAGQVEAATPGRAGRAPALANGAALDQALRPVGGIPIDVTTGLPMTTSRWVTDHLMPRAEIARDPRFPRLTPVQRDLILLDVPENYLPLSSEANSQKSDFTVDEWIVRRAAEGRPLPPEIVTALRSADRRARAAIEAKFRELLGE
ncbi:DUF4157 domain-containing protein [Kitasatospora sp. NPDC050543]|uniref:eCIS core domain-containing protein n=1 Tax=Kitasatospora sp. NPDC050543 TaxID=3364054 RepID=UPI0037B15119